MSRRQEEQAEEEERQTAKRRKYSTPERDYEPTYRRSHVEDFPQPPPSAPYASVPEPAKTAPVQTAMRSNNTEQKPEPIAKRIGEGFHFTTS